LRPIVQQAPAVVQATPTDTADRRTRMGRLILSYEARRDSAGRLMVHPLPPEDRGGSYEVAGINDKYHPQQAAHLRDLVRSGRHAEAEAAAIEFIVQYTNVAASWTTNAGVEFMLRDCVFHRGPRGAALILQRALNVEADGIIGPATRKALAGIGPAELLDRLRAAREGYERDVAGVRPTLWPGLSNRWDKALRDARRFMLETPTATAGGTAAAAGGTVAAGGGAAVATGIEQGWGWTEWGLLVLALLVLVGMAWLAWRLWLRRQPRLSSNRTRRRKAPVPATPLLDAAYAAIGSDPAMAHEPGAPRKRASPSKTTPRRSARKAAKRTASKTAKPASRTKAA
jgi:hypothetical protein